MELIFGMSVTMLAALFAVLGIGIIAYAIFGSSKKSNSGVMFGLLPIVAAFVLIFMASQTVVTTSNETTTSGNPPVTTCNTATTSTMTLGAYQKYAPATSATGIDLLYREKGAASWTAGVFGTGITAFSHDQQVEFLYANQTNTTNGLQTANIYYTQAPFKTGAYTLPCNPTPQIPPVALARKATPANIQAVVTDYASAAGATSVAMNANDEKTLSIRFTGQYQRDYGTVECGENSNVIAVYYNNTQQRSPVVVGQTPVACPQDAQSGNTENSTICFSHPVLQSNTPVNDQITLRADTVTAPVAAGGSVLACLYDSSYYQNSITSEWLCGVQDENNKDVGVRSGITVSPICVDITVT